MIDPVTNRPLFDPTKKRKPLAPKMTDKELDEYMEKNGYTTPSDSEKPAEKPKVRSGRCVSSKGTAGSVRR